MSPERWQKVEQLYHAALEREPDQRASFLAQVCDSDSELLAQVEKLLAAHDLSGSFIDSPAYEPATETLAGSEAGRLEGQTISHYRIVSRIGRGGMGEVFLAEDTRLDRKVAINLLPANASAEEQACRRFIREAKAAAALTGNAAQSRKEYQDFLSLWKDADADLQMLIKAKKEYERLK